MSLTEKINRAFDSADESKREAFEGEFVNFACGMTAMMREAGLPGHSIAFFESECLQLAHRVASELRPSKVAAPEPIPAKTITREPVLTTAPEPFSLTSPPEAEADDEDYGDELEETTGDKLEETTGDAG